MKKILFATTALGVAAAAPAFAAEKPTMTVGGYIHAGLAYGDGNNLANAGVGGADGFGLFHDGEIHFKFSGSSDNGLTFSGVVEMEAFSENFGDEIDEYYTQVSGSFGRVLIGANDTAFQNTAVGILYFPGAKIGYWEGFAWTGENPTYAYTGDTMALHYYTPTFNGFSAGISYHPDGGSDGLANLQNIVYADNQAATYGDNAITGGVSWKGDFEGVGLALGAGYATADDSGLGEDMDAWRVDGSVTFSGATLAVYYQDNNDAAGGADRGADIAVAGRYKTGPWTVNAQWVHAMDRGVGLRDYDQMAAGVTYAIAPGVSGTVGVQYTDSDTRNSNTVGVAYMSIGF